MDAKKLKQFKEQAEVVKWGLDGWSTKGMGVEIQNSDVIQIEELG
jgi:hypothetical protein